MNGEVTIIMSEVLAEKEMDTISVNKCWGKGYYIDWVEPHLLKVDLMDPRAGSAASRDTAGAGWGQTMANL
jgi:hypothetical protein